MATTLEDWKADLHILRGWAGGWKSLSEHFDYTAKTLQTRSQPSDSGASDEFIEKVRSLRERLMDQHRQHAQHRSHLIMVLQQIQRAEDWDDIERIQRRAEDIIDATEEPLITFLDE